MDTLASVVSVTVLYTVTTFLVVENIWTHIMQLWAWAQIMGGRGDMSPQTSDLRGQGDAEGDMSPQIHLIAVSKSKDKDQPN